MIQMKTFAIFSCAALFFTPLTVYAQLRRAGAPGIPAVGPDVNLGGPINRRGLR
jgi:hypothetical protein